MRPTREGRTGANRPGLVYKGIGIDPDAPTEDPPDPTDQAPGGDAEVAFLPPPDPGPTTDLNLAYGTDYDGGGDRPATDPTYANDGNLSTIAGRLSFYNGGGTKTWYLEADLGSALDVESIVIRGGMGNSGENDPPWVVQHSPDSSTWTTAVGSYVWTTAGTPETATLTLTSTQTKRYWRLSHTITYAGLIYPLKVHTWQINGPSAGDPTNLIWVDAPLTTDADDATYDYAYDTGITEFWRIDLGTTYLIDSIDARLAYETAGSNPLIVKATNESDYSSLVTIATVALTATGTFTAQDVTGSWTPSTAYRYWVLEQTTEDDIRVHGVELLTAAQSVTHPELTGRDDADQHPADSITFTPTGSIAATNVQDAIEEVALEAGGAGASVFAIASHSTTQAITTATFTRPTMNTDTSDVGGIHFTSDANLTGTVAKTAASAAIVGTGTSFTTELSVGQVISIPGTAAELGAVATITDNTHITLYQTMANTASGQVATRASGAVYAPRAGVGNVTLYAEWDPNATGERAAFLSVVPAAGGVSAAASMRIQAAPVADDCRITVPLTHRFVQGDVVSTLVRHTRGSNLNLNAVRLTLSMP